MKKLEEKILKDGVVKGTEILKVDSFVNHQIDTSLMAEMAEEIARLFDNEKITKVLTIEASGIAFAVEVGRVLGVPAVFAKKSKTSNMSGDSYCTKIKSFTHNTTYDVIVSKPYISASDNVLIVDDFLAVGNALNGLIDIVHQAGAKVAGCGIIIEKGFQKGGDKLREKGVRVESLAIVESMDGDKNEIVFRH